ncbi:hypothetical protein B9J07_12900 [Sinorhizobium sp. LM21]|uniref:hypothetical protein n=1 Tax=Sinorhizobium phage phiLM21 TaxID=1524882 RepID=UPI0004E5C4B4|nr:hypothetical protein AWJ26_gp18 [Sinorhizobium phage phiLM21]AII27770.1 hypothetical protein phiLM21_p018 [Sinorhizobium phage phiLM21]OWZ93534.1 hypothetical protein B9J07_12900 [Sinorhizobium sp. LM21]
MRKVGIGALALLLAGCSTSSGDLEANKSAARSVTSYNENYQAVYRRLADTARRCQSTAGTAAFTVDAQLYNELGFGEITLSLVSALYPRNYYWKAKVEKAGSGSKVSIVSGNTLAQDRTLRQIEGWAAGDTSC